MANLRVRIIDRVARRRLARFANPARNAERAGRAAANRLRDLIKQRFNTGTSPYAVKWKRGRKEVGRTLVETGRLMRSIRATRRGNVFVVGTTVPYARVHQFGATITPKRRRFLAFSGVGSQRVFRKKVVIPARPFFPLTRAGIPALPQLWRRQLELAAERALQRGRA